MENSHEWGSEWCQENQREGHLGRRNRIAKALRFKTAQHVYGNIQHGMNRFITNFKKISKELTQEFLLRKLWGFVLFNTLLNVWDKSPGAWMVLCFYFWERWKEESGKTRKNKEE